MNKDLKYMPIDNHAGSHSIHKHMSPLFQKKRESEAKGLRTDGGDNDVLLDDKKRTQEVLMKQLADKFNLNKTKENFDQFNKSKDSIAKVNQEYKGF